MHLFNLTIFNVSSLSPFGTLYNIIYNIISRAKWCLLYAQGKIRICISYSKWNCFLQLIVILPTSMVFKWCSVILVFHSRSLLLLELPLHYCCSIFAGLCILLSSNSFSSILLSPCTVMSTIQTFILIDILKFLAFYKVNYIMRYILLITKWVYNSKESIFPQCSFLASIFLSAIYFWLTMKSKLMDSVQC